MDPNCSPCRFAIEFLDAIPTARSCNKQKDYSPFARFCSAQQPDILTLVGRKVLAVPTLNPKPFLEECRGPRAF